MIDDYEPTMKLLEKMRSSLPILAKPTARSRQLLIEKGHNVNANDMFEIEVVEHGTDYAGIVCFIPFDEKNAVFSMSLTHLEVDPNHPLYNEIENYRQKRTIRLAIQDGKLGQVQRLAKKRKKGKKKGFGS